MSSCLLVFPGIRSSQDLDLSLLPLAFSLILTVASRLLHPYNTDDKTSRIIVTKRSSQSYVEKRRGKGEIEVTKRRRGGVKKGRDKSSQE